MERYAFHEVGSKTMRLLSAASVLWCLGATLVIWFSPITWTDHRVESFRQYAGPIGIGALALLCLLAVAASVGVFLGQRVLCTICSAAFLALSVVTGFSVGSPFIPAAVVLLAISLVARWPGCAPVVSTPPGHPGPTD